MIAEVVRIFEDCGIQAVAIHGRTRAQGYTGLADWEVIAACAEAARIPVIGNGDIATGADVEKRRRETKVSGVMIGRAAMMNPWVFREAKHYLQHGVQPPAASIEQRLAFMRRHCQLAILSNRYGSELQTMRAMRSRLMNYTKFLPGGKHLRVRFSQVASVMEMEDVLSDYLAGHGVFGEPESGL